METLKMPLINGRNIANQNNNYIFQDQNKRNMPPTGRDKSKMRMHDFQIADDYNSG